MLLSLISAEKNELTLNVSDGHLKQILVILVGKHSILVSNFFPSVWSWKVLTILCLVADCCRTARYALSTIAKARPGVFITSIAKEIAR